MADLITRTLTGTGTDDYFAVLRAAFLTDESLEQFQEILDPDRSHGVFDGSELIGVCSRLAPEMTLPGGTRSPVAAVTAVGVKPGHRRRGVLTSLMRAQLHGLHDDRGAPIAALFASEGAIYGRFGYGVASYEVKLAVPGGAPFLSTVDTGTQPVREVPRADALEIIRGLYPAATSTGWLTRDDGTWEFRVADDRNASGGQGKLHYAVHPGGFALYRPERGWTERGPDFKLHVEELVATTPQSYAALWRYLLDVDLVGEVHQNKAAVDEPITHLLANPRAAIRRVADGLWVRLVDVDRALPARRYSAPLDLVFELTDAFCPWNAGRWRLTAGDDGVAEVRRTGESAQLELDTADLASAFLGGNTLTALHRTGRITELEPGALRRASAAFATDRAPHCPEGF
ncbi:GNAT family N-acetyltransferase [Saccharopolyspora taberi]|uniref:Amikacin resistance N-acetyltransferase Eis2 n=1 Tax=Saccharopolyspora taberi TaxID=60895 RepID=A0ABN3V3D5_9PSEU